MQRNTPPANASAQPMIVCSPANSPVNPQTEAIAPSGQTTEKAAFVTWTERRDQPPAVMSDVMESASSGL